MLGSAKKRWKHVSRKIQINRPQGCGNGRWARHWGRHRKACPCGGEAAPGSEIIRGQDRIDAAEPQDGRQVQAADHAAGNEEGERDDHAAGAAAGRVERAGAAPVRQLHADAEHKGAGNERRPDRRNGAAEARD